MGLTLKATISSVRLEKKEARRGTGWVTYGRSITTHASGRQTVSMWEELSSIGLEGAPE